MLIVGLGNPGEEYDNTYHNLGFLAIDRLAVAHGIRVTRAEGKAVTGVGRIAGTDVVLAKPQTYMNLSGGSVKELLAKYMLPVDRLLLIYDELALDWGSMRIRPKGSAGGHNGVSSIIRSVGTEQIARIRLGIRPERPVKEMKSYVLAKIRRAQLETLDPLLDEVVKAVESIITEGVEKAMARFNARRAPGAKEET
ncbi:MAG: aminoacyl-tRNA hydrolase [Acidobacteria bacterium]|nr:aminoacyl-tRNA hydrolase [Acidobacteriota bacterium]